MTRSDARVAALLFAATLVATALLAWLALDRFPRSGDEHSYLFQARLFATGRLSAPSLPEALRSAFAVDHVVDDGRVRSKYPPGWPALLALGELAGAAWLVNPVVSALTVALAFLALRRFLEPHAALAGAASLALAPMFLLNGASFMSHPAVLLGQVAALYLVGLGPRGALWAALVAAATFLVRPLDGLILGALVVGVTDGDRRQILAGSIFAIGPLQFLAYNRAQFGSFTATGYAAYHEAFERHWGPQPPDLGLVNVLAARAHLGAYAELAAWTVPGALLTLPALWLWSPAPPEHQQARRFLLGTVAAFGAAIWLVVPVFGDSYGPRYLHPLLLPSAAAVGLVVARGSMSAEGRRWLALAGALALFLGVGRLVEETAAAAEHVRLRSTVYRMAAARGLHDAVVMIEASPDRGWPLHWYARNDPDYSQSALYAVGRATRAHAGVSDDLVAQRFPGRAFYRFVEDAQGRPVLMRSR